MSVCAQRQGSETIDTSLQTMCDHRSSAHGPGGNETFKQSVNLIKEQMRIDQQVMAQMLQVGHSCAYKCTVQIRPSSVGIDKVHRTSAEGLQSVGDLIPKYIIDGYNDSHSVVDIIKRAARVTNWVFKCCIYRIIHCESVSSDGTNVQIHMRFGVHPEDGH